jgi:pimeloyl-ACP methyl ester carboxylesterase
MRQFLVLAGAGTLAIACAAEAQQNRPTGAPPGSLIDVDGRSLHIHCVGSATGGPTVVLEAGAGDYSNRWAAVQDLLAPRIRSCAYDRAGFGWSSGRQQTMAQDNSDLRRLLTSADVGGPYVLVGHSMGALLVRRYFQRYPDGVVGMVLIGPTHENTRLFFPADNAWKRVREQVMGAEFQELHLARLANPLPLGERPLIVLVGTRADANVSTPDDIIREKAAELEDQARISRNSNLIRDPSSGHHIHVENPALVASAIEEVVTAAMNGTALAGAR